MGREGCHGRRFAVSSRVSAFSPRKAVLPFPAPPRRCEVFGEVSCGEGDVLGSGRAKCLVRYAIGPFDAAVSKIGGDALVTSSSKLRGALVMSEEDQGDLCYSHPKPAPELQTKTAAPL